MRRNIWFTAVIVVGLALAVWAADPTIFTTLEVTGVSTLTGAITATGGVVGDVTGDVTGAVTGNVTGDLTGDVTGNVTGNVTGDLTGTAVQTVALKGNLPAAAAGNKFEIYVNTAVDSGWISTGAAWTLMFP